MPKWWDRVKEVFSKATPETEHVEGTPDSAARETRSAPKPLRPYLDDDPLREPSSTQRPAGMYTAAAAETLDPTIPPSRQGAPSPMQTPVSQTLGYGDNAPLEVREAIAADEARQRRAAPLPAAPFVPAPPVEERGVFTSADASRPPAPAADDFSDLRGPTASSERPATHINEVGEQLGTTLEPPSARPIYVAPGDEDRIHASLRHRVAHHPGNYAPPAIPEGTTLVDDAELQHEADLADIPAAPADMPTQGAAAALHHLQTEAPVRAVHEGPEVPVPDSSARGARAAMDFLHAQDPAPAIAPTDAPTFAEDPLFGTLPDDVAQEVTGGKPAVVVPDHADVAHASQHTGQQATFEQDPLFGAMSGADKQRMDAEPLPFEREAAQAAAEQIIARENAESPLFGSNESLLDEGQRTPARVDSKREELLGNAPDKPTHASDNLFAIPEDIQGQQATFVADPPNHGKSAAEINAERDAAAQQAGTPPKDFDVFGIPHDQLAAQQQYQQPTSAELEASGTAPQQEGPRQEWKPRTGPQLEEEPSTTVKPRAYAPQVVPGEVTSSRVVPPLTHVERIASPPATPHVEGATTGRSR